MVTVSYSEEKSLNFGDYLFMQSGYLLAGWSTDESGGGWFADRNGSFNSDIGVEALYAVWLKLPESGNYAILVHITAKLRALTAASETFTVWN